MKLNEIVLENKQDLVKKLTLQCACMYVALYIYRHIYISVVRLGSGTLLVILTGGRGLGFERFRLR